MRIMKAISTAALGTSITVLVACGGGGSSTGGETASSGNNPATAPATNTPAGSPSTTPTTDTGTGNPATAPTTTTPDVNPGTDVTGPVSTASYAYILQAATNASSMTADTVYTGGSILKCSVDANGALTACSSAGMPTLNNPLSLTFSGSTAYILNQTAPDLELGVGTGGQYPVLRCAVEANGALSGCANTFPGDSTETEFAFKLIANPTSSYALKERQLLKCPSNFAGKCGMESSAAFPASVVASDMIFANSRLYVVNTGSGSATGSVLSWDVDPLTGNLSAAPATVTDATFATALRYDGSNVDSPREIALKGSHAYILTRYANKVVQCAYNSVANTMSACAETKPLDALPGITPRNIDIQGSYAYITDSSPTASGNAVVKCTIGSSDGRLGSCAAVPGPAFTTEIVDIVFR